MLPFLLLLLGRPTGRPEQPSTPLPTVPQHLAPPHLQLGVFQFFLCWFAFYVIKGDGGGSVDALLSRPQSAGLTSSVRKVGWGVMMQKVHGLPA